MLNTRNTISIFILFLLIINCSNIYGQSNNITGKVYDGDQQPIFAANVYLMSSIENGTTTDFDGSFILKYNKNKVENDTIVCSFLGFKTYKVALKEVAKAMSIQILLGQEAFRVKEIVVTYQDPITEKFAVTKMEMLEDVYMNPFSQGDPLKAVATTVSSTTTSETANISLRGSSPDRSRVVVNECHFIIP